LLAPFALLRVGAAREGGVSQDRDTQQRCAESDPSVANLKFARSIWQALSEFQIHQPH
jgi:hypothetical protein